MRNFITTITALIALTALFTAPANAQVISMQGYYQTATSGGCTAVFFSRTTYDARIASPTGSFTNWMKVADTCGLWSTNSTSNFAAFGYCTAGPLHDASPCSQRGLVFREWTVWPNCGRQLISQTDGAAYTGNAAAACIGSPIY